MLKNIPCLIVINLWDIFLVCIKIDVLYNNFYKKC